MAALGRSLGACLLALVLLPATGCALRRGPAGPSGVERLRADSASAFAELEGGRGDPQASRGGAQDAPPAVPSSSSPRPQPQWVTTGAGQGYTISKYVLGVGSARKARNGSESAALATAEDRARGAVAKNIKVRIQAEFHSAAHLVTESATGDTVVKSDANTIRDQISSQADLVLEGVEIVDRWVDSRTGAYWAFAALNRETAAETILERMDALRQRTRQGYQLGTELRKSGSAFKALQHLARALRNAFGILNYRSQLRVISPEHARTQDAHAADVNIGALWREASLARGELRIGMALFVVTDGHSATSWQAEAELSRTLRDIGFTTLNLSPPLGKSYSQVKTQAVSSLREWAGQANTLVLARLEAQKVASERLGKLVIHFYQARGELQVLDLTEGQVVATSGFDLLPATHTGDKVPARAVEEALLRAAKELGKRLRTELLADLALAE